MQESESTRDKIMVAAWESFAEKGYDGVRMQEIADRAGVNKAMIFYYYNSKEALFEGIFKEVFGQVFQAFQGIIAEEEIEPGELIAKMVHAHLQMLSTHPHLPKLMIREVNSGNPYAQKVLKETLAQIALKNSSNLIVLFQRYIKENKIRAVDPIQTLWNIIAMNLFYFIARPILQEIWTKDIKNEKSIFEKREKAIIDLLLYGLMPRQTEES